MRRIICLSASGLAEELSGSGWPSVLPITGISAEVRLRKLTEEVGEVVDAFLGVPAARQKGICRTRDDGLPSSPA